MMRERRIKELAIALEALSRIQQLASTYWEVEKLLNEQIELAKQEALNEKYPLKEVTPTPIKDDEIPF